MYSFRLTEEISRWAFEIICKGDNDWYVAFTNPTAGPWKTIKGLDKSGKEGEVYRFELEETRPDIVLVNDKLKIIIIVEAKDSIEKLTHGDQAEKSVEVVNTLTTIAILSLIGVCVQSIRYLPDYYGELKSPLLKLSVQILSINTINA